MVSSMILTMSQYLFSTGFVNKPLTPIFEYLSLRFQRKGLIGGGLFPCGAKWRISHQCLDCHFGLADMELDLIERYLSFEC